MSWRPITDLRQGYRIRDERITFRLLFMEMGPEKVSKYPIIAKVTTARWFGALSIR